MVKLGWTSEEDYARGRLNRPKKVYAAQVAGTQASLNTVCWEQRERPSYSRS